jgi:hypothetical protein
LSESSTSVTNKLDQVKNELRGFTSLHGFSNALNTSNPFVKVLWVFFFLVLFSFLIQNSLENINDYYQYTVITKIEYVNEYPITLPAVTVCLFSLLTLSTNATLDDVLYNCSISGSVCDAKEFYSFKTRSSENDMMTCYVLNAGRNSTGHSSKIESTRSTNPNSGLLFELYLPKDHSIYYYINDAYVEPTPSEIVKYLLPGRISNILLEKTVETKLEYPFNNCWERINLPDTPLVKQLYAANITYRQVNCFDLCLHNFIKIYTLKHELSENEARLKEEVKNYDKVKNCNHLCPLECENTQYKISESMFTLSDFSNIKEYSLKNIPFIQKKLNITVNSTEEFNKNNLQLFVTFDSLKYTKISQTPKTTLSALVSNLGGSTGLFLDLSFMSACRAIEFFLGIIFKF